MGMISSFRELTVYQRALKDARRVFVLTSFFRWKFFLTGQIRRSSRAVGAMIAGMIDRADDFCRHASK